MSDSGSTRMYGGSGSAMHGQGGDREVLLAELPVAEERNYFDDVATSMLVGGDGAPMVLLHGPGESAVKWLRVIPELVRTNRVVVPDLPAHGSTDVPGSVNEEAVVGWLDALVRSLPEPPVVVGHTLGGAIAARHAIRRPGHVAGLVLVDSLGLARFLPAPRFALGLLRVQARPTRANYDRFMRQCSHDLDQLVDEMGDHWEPYSNSMLEQARRPENKAVGAILRKVGMPRIPPADLARINVPTALIWGRQDLATNVRVAQAASKRHGWPLHVIENCADDPPRDRPREFLAALRSAAD
jgi:pimeloyl-ACP methyl ester carboxylesterase